jgi:flagellar protein FlaC
LNGFGGDVEADPEPRSSLTVEHHNASLRYISRIANPEMGVVAFDERNGWGESGSMGGAERVDRHAGRSSDPVGRSSANRAVESDGGRDIDARDGRRSTRHRPPGGSEPEPRDDGRFDWRDDHVD